jgi:hypothetical protein
MGLGDKRDDREKIEKNGGKETESDGNVEGELI